jgi:hypothetical protein
MSMRQEEAVKYWLEQSKFMWSRLQTISALEVAIVGGWYVLIDGKHSNFALPLLLSGTVFMAMLGLLVKRDIQYMAAWQRLAAGSFPDVDHPFLLIKGRWIAIAIPTVLLVANLVIAWTTR